MEGTARGTLSRSTAIVWLSLLWASAGQAVELVGDASGPGTGRATSVVEVSLGPEGLLIAARITLPKTDSRAESLLTGSLPPDEFVAALLGFLSLDDFGLTSLLRGESPVLRIDGGTLSVSLATDEPREPPGLGAAQLTASPLVLRWRGEEGAALDRLDLTLTGYRLRNSRPAPSRLIENLASWSGSQVEGGIEFELSRADADSFLLPRSIRDLELWPKLRQLQASVERVVGALTRVLLVSLPILLFLWWEPEARRFPALPAAYRSAVAGTAHGLLALALISVIFEVHGLLAELAHRAWGWLPASSPASGSAPDLRTLLALVPVFLAAWGLARFRRQRPLSRALYIVARALLLATLAAVALGLAIPALDRVIGALGHELATVLICWPVALWLLRRVRRFGDVNGVLTGLDRRWVFVSAGLLALATAFPISPLVRSTGGVPAGSWAIFWNVRVYLEILSTLTPLIVILGLVFALKPLVGARLWRRTYMDVSALLFAAFLVPESWRLPVILSFLLALWLFGPWVLQPPGRQLTLERCRSTVLARRAHWLRKAQEMASLKSLAQMRSKALERFASGQMTATELATSRKEVEGHARDVEREAEVAPGVLARDLVLAYSPERTSWASGVWAAKAGLVIAVPLVLVKYYGYLSGEERSTFGFFLLLVLSNVLPSVARFVLGGFFFGVAYEQLRGRSGLHKALFLATAIMVLRAPLWVGSLVTREGLASLVWSAGQTYLFYILLGTLAFDFRVLRRELGRKFDWRRFTWFGDVRIVATGASIGLGGVGLALANILQQPWIANAVKSIVQASFPESAGGS